LLTGACSAYNSCMEALRLHGWQVTVAEAKAIQRELAGRVCRHGGRSTPALVAGADISAARSRGEATAAVVVLRYPEMETVAVSIARGKVTFPYVPGLLSFREVPLLLAAFEKLLAAPDLLLVDGQGMAHPRRMGLACHLGLLLDIPAIGCAKSRLCGEAAEPGGERGCRADITDGGEVIGAALRTRAGVKPVYVSVGHKIDLEAALDITLQCCRGYRLPEPTRRAHLAAGGNLKTDGDTLVYGP